MAQYLSKRSYASPGEGLKPCWPEGQDAGCVSLGNDGEVMVMAAGRVAAHYYLRHQTLAHFTRGLRPGLVPAQVRPYVGWTVREVARFILYAM